MDNSKSWRPLRTAVVGAALATAALMTTLPAATAAEVRIGVNDIGRHGNPFAGRGNPGTFLWNALFDPLALPDENGAPQPVLAAGWKIIDPTTWEFSLRSGIKYSNGETFDAKAVQATLRWLLTEKGQASVVGREFRSIASVEMINDTTVRIHTKAPDPILINKLAMVYIVAPKAWADLGEEGFNENPAGTGPFVKDTFAADALTLKQNPSSWHPGKVDKVSLLGLPEQASRLQALLSNQIDIAIGMGPDNIGQMESAGIDVLVTSAPQVMSIMLRTVNNGDTPLKDRRVRQALNYAVDTESMARDLLLGKGKAASQGGTPVAFGYDPSIKPYPYDPAKAKALLAEAGFPNGFPMKIEVITGSFPSDADIYQKAAQDLEAVGIKVDMQKVTFPDWLKKFLGNAWQGDAFGSSWNSAPYMDSVRPYSYQTCAKSKPHFCDEEQTPLYKQVSTEMDPIKRKAALLELHRLTKEVAPAIFLVEQIDVTGVSKKVTNFRYVNRNIDYKGLAKN